MTSALLSGPGLGSMQGLMALGFYVTYAVVGTVNFAQGSSMMLGVVFTYGKEPRCLSALFAGMAGGLIAPLLNVNADMDTLFGPRAFAVALLGGITSA